METRWLYTTSENFPALREASKDVCVIPMGCVEKHGLHLPVGTDILQASTIAYMASQIEPVTIFPDFTFGDKQGNQPSRPLGTICIPLKMELDLLEELCEQIAKNGYKKIMVFNGHGGNGPWLAAFSRMLSSKKRDFVFSICPIKLQAPHMMAEYLEKNGRGSIPELTTEDEDLLIKYHKEDMLIGHGGMGETSYMLDIAPETVHLDRLGIESGKWLHITDYLMEAGIQIRDAGWQIDFPNSYAGDDPIGVNERIGKAALRMEVERVAKAYKLFKEDENLLKWHDEMQKGW